MSLVKAMIATAAAQLAAGVVANLPDDLKVDPEISSDQTKAENLMAFRVAHIFYDGLCRALDPNNPQGWQTPAWMLAPLPGTDPSSPLGQLARLALEGLQADGPVAQIIQQLLGTLVKQSPTSQVPSGPIPSPAEVAGGTSK